MGGYNASALVEGANQALRDSDGIELFSMGMSQIKPHVASDRARQHRSYGMKKWLIRMMSRSAIIRKKKQASMVLAAKAVKDGEADGPVCRYRSALWWALPAGRIKNIDRPGLLSTLPTVDGRGFDMLDLGQRKIPSPSASICYPRFFMRKMFVALSSHGLVCSIMALEGKGDPLCKETYALLSEDDKLNFIGNVVRVTLWMEWQMLS